MEGISLLFHFHHEPVSESFFEPADLGFGIDTKFKKNNLVVNKHDSLESLSKITDQWSVTDYGALKVTKSFFSKAANQRAIFLKWNNNSHTIKMSCHFHMIRLHNRHQDQTHQTSLIHLLMILWIFPRQLDILTGTEHRKTIKVIEDQKSSRRDDQVIDFAFRDHPNTEIDFDSLRSLAEFGFDVSFVDSIQQQFQGGWSCHLFWYFVIRACRQLWFPKLSKRIEKVGLW